MTIRPSTLRVVGCHYVGCFDERPYDGSLAAFRDAHGNEKVIEVEFARDMGAVEMRYLRFLREKDRTKWFVFNKDEIGTVAMIDHLIHTYEVVDFHVKEPLVEDIVRSIYESSNP